jgi:yecA family protein
MPPNLRTYGAAPFGDPQRARLTSWLREAGWPRGHMEIAELEGYLVALISWPVEISSGAWLPPIWGERGWKVPTKIAVESRYQEFAALVIGFMQNLDGQLSGQPSQFESSVLHGLREREHSQALHAWGRGFMTALTLGSQGLKGRSDSVCAAVHAIARSTASSAPFRSRTVDDVKSAVFSLMDQRPPRAPAGPLDPPARARDMRPDRRA